MIAFGLTVCMAIHLGLLAYDVMRDGELDWRRIARALTLAGVVITLFAWPPNTSKAIR